MRQTSGNIEILRDIETAIKTVTCEYLFASREEEEIEEDIKDLDLLSREEVIVSHDWTLICVAI